MAENELLIKILEKHRNEFHQVVPFVPSKDRWLMLDLTDNNKDLNDEVLNDSDKFSSYIAQTLKAAGCKFGIGGYAEYRTIYQRSKHFDSPEAGEEPRRVHLGIDIWGAVNTAVIAPLDGIVHSFAFNNNFGDYGATIILTHNLEGVAFYSLYGHLSLNSLKNLTEGDLIRKGDIFAEFGMQFENGHWPPHLHFQLINDLQGKRGDYPGVCKYSEQNFYLKNCPDPDLILKLVEKV
jgi:murein DD-endopeptidase MepM/ murein hydrolase activator NlpD